MKQTKTTEMERRMRKQCIVKKVVKKEREINKNAQTINLSLSDGYYGTINYPVVSLEKSLNTNSALIGLRIIVSEYVSIDISVAEVACQVWVDVDTAHENEVITKKMNVARGNSDLHKNYSKKSYAQCGAVEVTLKNNDEHLQWLKNNKKRI